MNVKKILLLFSFMYIPFSFADNTNAINSNILKINTYFKQDKESLPSKELLALSKEVFLNRHWYENEELGKLFVLLAEIAINKGEKTSAFQFSKDGLTLTGLSKPLQLNLLLKIAAGHYTEGQFNLTEKVASNVIVQANTKELLQYKLIALSYRSVASALMAKQKFAFNDLQRVEALIKNSQEFSDRLDLLEVLATAHYYLGEYSTALAIQNKLLQLRFKLNKLNNLDFTYLNLAKAYQKLEQYDDAYNAFWEAKQHSLKKSAPILVAYAELGLGEVLVKQNKFKKAFQVLISAKEVFLAQNLSKPYINNLIFLAKAAIKTNRATYAEELLLQAESIASKPTSSFEHAELYLMLSTMYQKKQLFQKALATHQTYLSLLLRFNHQPKPAIHSTNNSNTVSEKSKNLVLNLAEQSELRAQYRLKFIQQQQFIYFLLIVIILILAMALALYLRKQKQKRNQAYDEIEGQGFDIANAIQTKKLYQLNYKKARRYDYNLAVGYISIVNWQELSFHFNQKIMSEVGQAIASLLNEHKGEFDEVGLINDGEYLLLSPHQNIEELEEKLKRIVAAIKLRFFANLGDFSVKVGYAFDCPTAQDIDPYIFLSRLSEATKAKL